jgi:hypothetical protein
VSEDQVKEPTIPSMKKLTFEEGMVEVSKILFSSFVQHSVKPTVAKIWSHAAAKRFARSAGTAAFARMACEDPSTDAAYADV